MLFLLQIVAYSDTSEAIWEYFYINHCYFHIKIEIWKNEGRVFSSGRLQLLMNSHLQN